MYVHAVPDDGELWFAGEPGTLYLFKVNRRPWPDRNLFTPEQPDDPFEHFRSAACLAG
jgi:hypothetical protein